jgi:hypothetical protein
LGCWHGHFATYNNYVFCCAPLVLLLVPNGLFAGEISMDTFENASPPQEQPEKVLAKCWECGEMKMCFEHIVCCTGTRFHTCPACRVLINQKAS